MTFFDRLKSFMDNKKLNGRELTRILGINSANYTFWKQGSLPRADLAVRIAKEVGSSVEYLVTGESSDGLDASDTDVLEKLHSLSPESKNAVLTLLDALSKQEAKSTKLG